MPSSPPGARSPFPLPLGVVGAEDGCLNCPKTPFLPPAAKGDITCSTNSNSETAALVSAHPKLTLERDNRGLTHCLGILIR